MLQRLFRKPVAVEPVQIVAETIKPTIDKERISGDPTYSEDCLRTRFRHVPGLRECS